MVQRFKHKMSCQTQLYLNVPPPNTLQYSNLININKSLYPVGKIAKIVNSALKIQGHIVKNTLPQTAFRRFYPLGKLNYRKVSLEGNGAYKINVNKPVSSK